MAKTANPLKGYLRSPKLYITLPSGGKFSNIQSISDISAELPICALTSMDETILRNPDALLNGESLVKVIQSCTGIKDVYELTSNDVDVILLAIRYATYGNDLGIVAACPECSNVNDVTVNIEPILETVNELEDSYDVTLESGLQCFIKPYTFRDSQRAALAAFRETSELNNLINDNADDLAKLATFNKSFIAMAELNIEILSSAVIKVIIPATDEDEEQEVKNHKHILEWIKGINKSEADMIINELNTINDLGVTRETTVTCEKCAHEYETRLEFNPSTFFETGS